MDKLGRAQKCLIWGHQNLHLGGPGLLGVPGSTPGDYTM